MTNCANCGTANTSDASYCEKCGQPLATAALGATAAVAGAPVPAVAPRTNSLAVASLLLGLLSLFVPFAILAVILGHVARSRIRKSAGRQKGAGMALAGLILGYLGVGFILFGVLIVLPSLNWH